jgi:hypothetical protein
MPNGLVRTVSPAMKKLPPTQTAKPDPLKHWAMILFESLSFGVLAILLVAGVVLLAVGIYVQLIWPLTEWSLVSVNLDSYRPLIDAALLSIFGFASGLGFWFVSGAAWKR